jgi:hypothetical protein
MRHALKRRARQHYTRAGAATPVRERNTPLVDMNAEVGAPVRTIVAAVVSFNITRLMDQVLSAVSPADGVLVPASAAIATEPPNNPTPAGHWSGTVV